MDTSPWGSDWTAWMPNHDRFHEKMRRKFERHGRPGFWQEFVGEPGPRADRGVVRYLVLDSVATQPRHGYEIMQAIAERSGGTYRPSPGVIYPTLQMLEELRHVHATESDGRKVFSITEEGKRDLADHQSDVDDFFDRAESATDWEDHAETFAELAADVGKLFRLFRKAARRGRLTSSVKKAIRAELDGAIERIEAILDRR